MLMIIHVIDSICHYDEFALSRNRLWPTCFRFSLSM